MKNLVFVLAVLFPFHIQAQTFWSTVNDSYNKSESTDSGLFQDSLIIVAGKLSSASCPYSGLFAYNLHGTQVWEAEGVFSLVETDSDFIYTAGFTFVDDVAGHEQVVITKLDAKGNIIYSVAYPEIPYINYYEFIPVSIDVSEDGIILVASKNSVVKTDTSGMAIVETLSDFKNDITGILIISSNSYVISTKNVIYKTDENFVINDSLTFNDEVIKTLIVNDTLHSLFNDKLIRFNSNFEILDTVISSVGDKFRDFEVFGESIYIESVEDDKISLIELQNKSISDTLYFDLLCNTNGFVVSEGRFVFTGNSPSNQMALYGFTGENLSAAEYLPNIEIVDFEIGNIKIDNVIYQGDTIPRGYFFNTEMKLKNIGKDTIKSFALYSDLHGGMNCAQNYYYQKFTDIEISPNQTVSVQLNRIYEDRVYNNEICFECLAPNSMLETDVENNFLCKTFTITGVPYQPENSKIRVYPNPVSDELKIELDGTSLKNISLSDINGKNVYQKNTDGQSEIIDFRTLETGAYILSISANNKKTSQIIIKV